MVNLEWYRTFKAIYQNGTLTKAAEELLISQPNVSIQLASLETYIGRPLFTRLPRKMEPTESGKLLYAQIVEAIENLERVEAEFKKAILNKAPTIRIGSPSEIVSNYLVYHLKSIDCDIDFVYGMADKLTEMLSANELDIAIVTKQLHTDIQLTYEPMHTESFIIVCNYQMDTNEFDQLVAEGKADNIEKWLKKQDWYTYGNNLILIRRFWRENFKKRPILKPRIVIPDNNALLEAISQGNALVVSSDLLGGKAIADQKVKVLWKGMSPTLNTVYMTYNKARISTCLLDKIRVFITASLQDIPFV